MKMIKWKTKENMKKLWSMDKTLVGREESAGAVLFFKSLINQRCFKFCCIHNQIYLIQQIWLN